MTAHPFPALGRVRARLEQIAGADAAALDAVRATFERAEALLGMPVPPLLAGRAVLVDAVREVSAHIGEARAHDLFYAGVAGASFKSVSRAIARERAADLTTALTTFTIAAERALCGPRPAEARAATTTTTAVEEPPADLPGLVGALRRVLNRIAGEASLDTDLEDGGRRLSRAIAAYSAALEEAYGARAPKRGAVIDAGAVLEAMLGHPEASPALRARLREIKQCIDGSDDATQRGLRLLDVLEQVVDDEPDPP